MTARNKYPALMAYIEDRSANFETVSEWCSQLRKDEVAAEEGSLADVAHDLIAAKNDYTLMKEAEGKDGYPNNSSMGIFLGLPLKSNHEPPHGYYMASCVMKYFLLGRAKREVAELLAAGACLRLVAARDRVTKKPIRFTTFLPHQIHIEGRNVRCQNDRKSVRLSSNWSVETTMEAVADALRTGSHYGYDRARDGAPEYNSTAQTAVAS